MRKMKKHSKEFKEEALKLSDEIGVKKAASQLGLQYYTLAEWRKNRKAATRLPDPAPDAEQKAHKILYSTPFCISISFFPS